MRGADEEISHDRGAQLRDVIRHRNVELHEQCHAADADRVINDLNSHRDRAARTSWSIAVLVGASA